MKKTIRSLLSCLLAAALLLSGVVTAYADPDYLSYSTVDEIRTSGCDEEYILLRTPSGEKRTLYVEGVCASDTKMILIRMANKAESTVMRVFVRPEADGSFAVRINTAEGSKEFPTATAGTVVKDEKGGQTSSRCYGTIPGYGANPALNGLYRVTVSRTVTDEEVDSVYDGGWSGDDNTLSGSRGYLCKELVVEMNDNDPQVVDYENIRLHNAEMRSLDADLTAGSPAWIRYTDTYMKDCERLMDTTGVTHPMDAQKVAYIKSVADELTASAETDYEKVLRIYEYLADNFYYDNYAYNNDNEQQYCNPYDNLRCLRDGAEGLACSEGRVATVCNGYSAMVVALARALGIPARMARGYHITGSTTVWSNNLHFTSTVSHYWAEVYVDGRWMAVDATRGSQNEWRRTGWDDESDEAWVRGDVRTYVGFDIPDLILANNYFYLDYYSEYKDLLPPVITGMDTSTGNVIISWDSVEGAEKYYIYRGESDDALSYLCTVQGEQFIACSEKANVPAYYRVRAVGDGVEGTYSNLQVVTLTPEECARRHDGAITGQPQSVSASPGDSVTFSVQASGDYLSYCWQVCLPGSEEWTNSGAEGAKTDTIHVNAILSRSGQRYRCIVKNGDYDKMISDEATLTVEQSAPTITNQPAGRSGKVGDTVKFTVKAAGADLTYQWYYKAPGGSWAKSSLTGNKTATLTVGVTAARNGYQYKCRVSNAGGSIYSKAAKLTVSTTVTAQPADRNLAVGKTAKFTVSATGAGLAYQWYYKAPGGSWAKSSLTGNKTATLTVSVTSARNGYQYKCLITDANGGKLYTAAAKLTVKTAITSQPESVSTAAGKSVNFTVRATGAGLVYQWQYRTSSAGTWKSSGATGNKTATLTVTATAARSGYQYRCVITDANGKKTYSAAATLTVK